MGGRHYTDWKAAGIDACRRRWDRHFRESQCFSLAPNQLLVETIESEPPGRALDLGVGQGRNAVFLATMRWEVTGVDISEEGLRLAGQAAARRGVTIELINEELERYAFVQDAWDLVTMIYVGSDESLVRRILPGLRPGGLLVCEYFHADSEFSIGAGGWATGALATTVGDGFQVLRDEVVIGPVDWANRRETTLVRFVARRRRPCGE